MDLQNKKIASLDDKAEPKTKAREILKVAIVGHVDHGKSTFVGRLFHDTDSLPEGKYESIVAMCEKRGVEFEYAFLMDSFQAERDQGITIDTSQIWFNTDKRDYTIIDAPGHKEFLKNMVTGAAQSDAALLMIDALEGVQEQSRRHGYLLNLLGVNQIAVVVNKMDLVDYSEERFNEIETEYRAYLESIGVNLTRFIPISAREGDNIVKPSDKLAWYKGLTVTEALDDFKILAADDNLPLRLPVQDVYKFDDRRIIAGTIVSGQLRIGDKLTFSPSGKEAIVKNIEAWPNAYTEEEKKNLVVGAGQSVGITLTEQIFVERGDVISHIIPAEETDILVAPHLGEEFTAKLFWLGQTPFEVGKNYKMKLGTAEVNVRVKQINHVLDAENLSQSSGDQLLRNQLGEVVLTTRSPIALDDYRSFAKSGRFVLLEKYDIAGGGVINLDGYKNRRADIFAHQANITRVDHAVSLAERENYNGHKGGVLWLTGLSGSGKSTLAVSLERKLFRKGMQVYVLDGDNLRYGLNNNLGFSEVDRRENIRRASEIAALMARAGFIVIVSLISPFKEEREKAALIQGAGFFEVYVNADLATCEKRDPKGLYKKARSGEITDFTGISSPYEAPTNPAFVVDTAALSIEEGASALLEFATNKFHKEYNQDYSI
ncbi:MAG: adenylyl-sulfate kinase [Rhizobiales bacterium]|nr:adenylyl-sulfate kinase [Hyphomicrobiales bacterium]